MTADEVTLWARKHLELELKPYQAAWVSLTLAKEGTPVQIFGSVLDEDPAFRTLEAIYASKNGGRP